MKRIADAGKQAGAKPATVALVDVRFVIAAPADEDGVRNRAVLTETPLASDWSLVSEGWVVGNDLGERDSVGGQLAELILFGEIRRHWVVVQFKEPDIDLLRPRADTRHRGENLIVNATTRPSGSINHLVGRKGTVDPDAAAEHNAGRGHWFFHDVISLSVRAHL